MRYLFIVIAFISLLAGCTPAQIYANANAEAQRNWAELVAYDIEQDIVREKHREECLEKVIWPGIDRLIAEGRQVEATKVYKANYPGVTYVSVLKLLDEEKRKELLEPFSKMPACEWPEDIVFEQPAAATTAPIGAFMLTPMPP